MIARAKNWGEDRVSFEDDDGTLRLVPVSWTTLATPDPFEVVSAGRASFRPDDLLRLADLVAALRREQKDEP